jgi:tripartite ATP-independent transporter DctP family solute receptor
MMLKKFRYLALVMALILVFISCTTFAADKPIKLIYGHQWQKTELFYKEGDLYFQKLLKKKSKGKILVEIYPAGQLGSIPEQIQAVKTNSQQMTFTPVGEFIPYWSKLGTFDLPYIYRDQKHFLKVAKRFSSLIDQNAMAAKTGLRVIGTRIRAPRQLTTKFPVNKLKDIKGIKIRVSESPVSIALWKALGTVPIVVPGQEIYTALAAGTVDAQENPFESIYAGRLYEQVKYCALTAHKQEIVPIVISNIFWKTLKVRQQKIIRSALEESNKRLLKFCLKSEEEYKNLLVKEGMKFTKPDLAPFRERAKTIWKEFGDDKLIKKIQTLK